MDEVKKKLFRVMKVLEETERRIEIIRQKMDELEQAGMTSARLHWRKDRRGEPKILELLHSTRSEYYRQNGRRRQYVGTDDVAIAEARQKVERYRLHQKLNRQRKKLERKSQEIRRAIDSLEMLTFEYRQQPLGTVGTGFSEKNGSMSPELTDVTTKMVSPQDMSPQDVLEYFSRSPVLAGLVDDLKDCPAFRDG
ncbi:MAG: hypothetical protein D6784_08895 [Chloroflexi bacterium]|nr:MAG: hypothetical protein D6784_08895 [Chloroflexota bacterium]